ncbi:hypothetical protein ES703_67403 [subsurface metagenome]
MLSLQVEKSAPERGARILPRAQKMARDYTVQLDGGDSIYPPPAVGISQRYQENGACLPVLILACTPKTGQFE